MIVKVAFTASIKISYLIKHIISMYKILNKKNKRKLIAELIWFKYYTMNICTVCHMIFLSIKIDCFEKMQQCSDLKNSCFSLLHCGWLLQSFPT